MKKYNIKNNIEKLIKAVSKTEKSNKEKAELLGRSYTWYLSKTINLGLRQKRKTLEEWFDIFDDIPNNTAKVIKGYSIQTIYSKTKLYRGVLSKPIKAKITETKTGIAVKFIKNA